MYMLFCVKLFCVTFFTDISIYFSAILVNIPNLYEWYNKSIVMLVLICMLSKLSASQDLNLYIDRKDSGFLSIFKNKKKVGWCRSPWLHPGCKANNTF